MLVKAHEAARAIARFNPDIRLYLFGGSDESGSAALRDQVVATIGTDAERFDVSLYSVKEDPALIADEAASISLFGGARWISISVNSGSGDELLPSIENLLGASAAGNPVIITISGLTAKSRLMKIAERDDRCMAVISYPIEAKDVERTIAGLAAPLGLVIDRVVGAAIAESTGRDRGLMAREVEKLALYCDASPGERTAAALADWQAIGADIDGNDLNSIINATFGGKVAALPLALAELDNGGALDIRLVRALASRAHLLTRLRISVENGMPVGQVMAAQGKAIFWKERDDVQRQLARWDAPRLARVIARLHRLESDLKAPDNAGALLVRQAVMEISRAASPRS
ncbi:MAG: DNA polymerase III subunit delta [Sphingopyxis sp.]